jgi:hypothetical protein
MEIVGEIVTPYYDYGGRKYIDLRWNNTVIRVKVPFRYGRVMCKVEGITPVQDLQAGQIISALCEKKTWEGSCHYVVYSIRLVSDD